MVTPPPHRRVCAVLVGFSSEQPMLAAGCAGEPADGWSDLLRRIAKTMQQRDDCPGVRDILLADEPQGKVAKLLAGVPDFEASMRRDAACVTESVANLGLCIGDLAYQPIGG